MGKGWNAGVGSLTAGYQQSLETYQNKTVYTNWNMYSAGYSLGSKSFLGGNINSVTTSRPIYIFRHNC